MRIIVYHDTVCPFCRIGKIQLRRSLQDWPGEPVAVVYRAFFLNPSIPPEGYDFIPYMTAKFNGQIRLEQAFEGPRRLGEAAGVVFNMDRITRAPNSLLSHCLIALAPMEAREALIEDVYAAYFEHGQDIGDLETLLQIGRQHGLNPDRLRLEITGAAVQAQVEAEAEQARRLGINGVPFFIINDHYAFSGAQPPELISNVLRRIASPR